MTDSAPLIYSTFASTKTCHLVIAVSTANMGSSPFDPATLYIRHIGIPENSTVPYPSREFQDELRLPIRAGSSYFELYANNGEEIIRPKECRSVYTGSRMRLPSGYIGFIVPNPCNASVGLEAIPNIVCPHPEHPIVIQLKNHNSFPIALMQKPLARMAVIPCHMPPATLLGSMAFDRLTIAPIQLVRPEEPAHHEESPSSPEEGELICRDRDPWIANL